MGIQSAVMAKQFGENFQYGKRRISAMSNEEFNKLTPADLQQRANAELKSMIPSMEQSVVEMRTFQTFLIREFLRTLNDAIKAGFGELFGINDETLTNIEHYLHGHGAGHDEGAPPPPGETVNLDEFKTVPPPPDETPPTDEETDTSVNPPKSAYYITWVVYGNDDLPISTAEKFFTEEGQLINLGVQFLRDLLEMQKLKNAGGGFNIGSLHSRIEVINYIVKHYPSTYTKIHNIVVG